MARLRAWLPLGIAAGLGVWLVVKATALGGDANWDLRNYHLYGPFALFHPETAGDISPAQSQTWHPPMLDIPYYLLVRSIRSVPVLNGVLAVPHGVVAGLAFLVAVQVLGMRDLPGLGLAAVAAVIGLTGAAAQPTLATTMDESIPVALVLGGLLLLARDGTWTGRRVLAAGLLCGAAAGLKLTTSTAGAGLGLAVVAVGGGSAGMRARRGAAFAAGAVVGAVAVAGWWWARLYAETGNPLFPYFNAVFRSPLLPPANAGDIRFFPQEALQWAAYPFYWAVQRFRGPAELPIRDPRFALATLGTLAMAVQAVRRPQRAPRLFVVFLGAGYALWLYQFSILRYLSCLEPLTGVAVLGALRPVLRQAWARWAALPPALLAAVGLVAFTHLPDWERVPRCRRAECPPPIDVRLPPVPAGSLLLSLDSGPVSYLRVFLPAPVRFVGANNNLIHLNRSEPLQRRVQQAIDSHSGEIFGLEEVEGSEGMADKALDFYRLQRDSCTRVESNMDHGRIQICRLRRNGR